MQSGHSQASHEISVDALSIHSRVQTKISDAFLREYFLDKFFPSVWEAEYGTHKFTTASPYCKFDSQTLQLFQSSLYIAGKEPLFKEVFSLISFPPESAKVYLHSICVA